MKAQTSSDTKLMCSVQVDYLTVWITIIIIASGWIQEGTVLQASNSIHLGLCYLVHVHCPDSDFAHDLANLARNLHKILRLHHCDVSFPPVSCRSQERLGNFRLGVIIVNRRPFGNSANHETLAWKRYCRESNVNRRCSLEICKMLQ